jgi:hypothetical protein
VADQPRQFVWRDRLYTVAEVLATWHLRNRWWEPVVASPTGASDRHYYRLQCTDGLLCDLYHDVARDVWVLDRVHD